MPKQTKSARTVVILSIRPNGAPKAKVMLMQSIQCRQTGEDSQTARVEATPKTWLGARGSRRQERASQPGHANHNARADESVPGPENIRNVRPGIFGQHLQCGHDQQRYS